MAEEKNEIELFISDNETMRVEVSPGVSYSMRDVINRLYRIYNAQFLNNPVEASGFKNIFFRKMWVVYRTLIQGSDVDLKNLNIRSTNGVKIRLVALLRAMFVSHLSRTSFGELIDKIMAEMCWFGTSIIKRFNGTVETVDLRNYITEPNIQDPQERRHAEMCYYSYDEVMANRDEWKGGWEDVMNVWEEMQKANESQFKILEFWTFGKVKGDDNIHKICIKYLDNTITRKDDFHNIENWRPYIELERFKTPYRKRRTSRKLAKKLGEYEELFPYEQFDLFKMFGRTFALGCGELLEGLQEVYNELFNEKRKLTRKALNGITIHTAVQGTNGLTQLTQDFISNLSTGSVITLAPGETLTQEQINTQGSDFNLMEEKIYELMRQIIGITAQGTGEELPASTSATQVSINQQVANTVFDYTRERMHHGLRRLFNNGYADDIIDELSEQETVAISGEPSMLEEFDNMLIENACNKWALEVKNTIGIYPTKEEYDREYNRIKLELAEQKDMRFPKFKKELLKDMEYYLEFDITEESVDYKGRTSALMSIKADPTSTKSKAKVEDELLALYGLNPRQYDKTPEEIQQSQQAIAPQAIAQQAIAQQAIAPQSQEVINQQ